MPPSSIRKLAILVHAEVAESALLAQRHEALAHQRIQSCYKGLAQVIAAYGGITRELRGGALVGEFDSAAEALCASLAFQSAQNDFVDRLGDDIKPRVLLGIAMGEVINDVNAVSGSGVVIAQRLAQLATPGEVVIQASACETLPSYFPFDFRALGEQTLQGFDQPIRCFQVTLQDKAVIPEREVLPIGRAGLPLPDRPSIAVLPFVRNGYNKGSEYFGEGLAEEVIRELSRQHWLFVISHNSSLVYRERIGDLRNVARELGVRYLLDGHFRYSGLRVELSLRLLDVVSDQLAWTLKDEFESADWLLHRRTLIRTIIRQLAPKPVTEDTNPGTRLPAQLVAARADAMHGRGLMWRLAPENLVTARDLFHRALAQAPGSGCGASDIACSYLLEACYGWSESPEHCRRNITRFALQAVARDEQDAWGHCALAYAWVVSARWQQAMAALDRAITQFPNFAPALGIMSLVLAYTEDTIAAHERFAQARRLSPHDSLMPLWLMAEFWACFVDEEYGGAERAAIEFVRLAPENPMARFQLAVACVANDKADAGRQALKAGRRLELQSEAGDIRDRIPSNNPETLDRFIELLALAEAGEEPGP